MIYFTPITHEDLPKVKEIYDHYILNTTTTFHSERIPIPVLEEIIFLNNPRYPSFLIREGGEVTGYYFLTRLKKQEYKRTAELSIHLKPGFTGRRISQLAIDHIEQTERGSI